MATKKYLDDTGLQRLAQKINSLIPKYTFQGTTYPYDIEYTMLGDIECIAIKYDVNSVTNTIYIPTTEGVYTQIEEVLAEYLEDGDNIQY